ncbi:hypothetical protein [Motiliproteus sp.]|uniref:hypothetical protein n=1 Tax=Motiliproteus sp. TaxID=1898955 RepID=UPI003BACA14E
MKKLSFRLTYTLRDIDISHNTSTEFNIGGEHNIHAILTDVVRKDRRTQQSVRDTVITVYSARPLTRKAAPVFEAFFEGKRPQEGTKATEPEELIAHDGPCWGLSYYPNPFVSYVRSVYSELSSIGTDIAKLLRWRLSLRGPSSPVSSQSLWCSVDEGATWTPLPNDWHIRLISMSNERLAVDRINTDQICKMVAAKEQEPLSHELLREAIELQNKSPRSSILIAVSAAEVAVKSVIANKCPQATWLLDELQSPPLTKMLVEYFPALLHSHEPLFIPDRKVGLVKSIDDAVAIRNRIVHKGSSPPNFDKLEEILTAIQQLLWICDYWSGYKWAAEHLEPQVAKPLN